MLHQSITGDDILDDIEAGSADDSVMSKYKINGDQLKAFKSLHYGLSNEKMGYDEIGDYYPELESYFKRPAPLMPLPDEDQVIPSSSVPGADQPAPEPDIFKLVQDKVRLGKEDASTKYIGGSSQTFGGSAISDYEKTSKARKDSIAAINDQLKQAGYDPDEVTKALGDLPAIPGFNAKDLLQLQKDNPLAFERKKAAIKSQYSLLHAIDKKEGANAANAFINNYQLLQSSDNYADQRQATKNAINAVHKYVDDTDEQNRIIKDIVRDKSFGYGVGLPGQEESITNDPRSERLNPYQVAAMQFLDDVDPGKAQAYNRLMAFSPEEVEKLDKNSSFARGYEAKSRDLENIGMNLMRNSLEEKLTAMLKNKDKWSEADKQNYAAIYERYNTLSEDIQNQNKRYPALAVMDADRLMQDAMGSSNKGVVEKTVLGIGENVDDVVNWIGDLIQEPFRSSKETALDDLQQLGDKKLSQLGQYETEGQELFNRQFKTTFTGPLKTKIDSIKANSSLSDDEQRDAITKEILTDNNKNVKYLPNDHAGKMNFTAKTVTNAVSNVISEIVPQIALAYLSGGAANASKMQELTSLFSSTFATAYNDIYNEAIEKDIPNPAQYALVHTTIEAGTELLFNDVDKLKKLFGGKIAGKVLEGVTEEGMQAIARTGRFAKLGAAIKAMGKTGLKDAGQEGLEEAIGAASGNIADKKLFNQEVNVTDDVLKEFMTTAIGMLPLAGLGLPFRYKEINQMQKNALYEAAMNPEKFLAKVDDDLQNNRITPSEAEARKETITKAAKLARAMNTVRSDGSILTDNEKTEMLTNEVVADTVNEKKKNAPEETKEQLIKVEETLDKEKEKLLKPKKNANKRKAKTETNAEAEGTGNVTPVQGSTETSPPGADNNIGVEGESAPAGDLHYTTPEGESYVLRGDDLYYVGKDGTETKFAKKSLQTPEAQEFIAKIKSQTNQSVPAGVPEQTTAPDSGEQTTGSDQGTAVTHSPTGDLHYTNPEGTQYVLRGNDLYHVDKRTGKETKFAEKAMQTKDTKDLIAKIKEVNNVASGDQSVNTVEPSTGNKQPLKIEELEALPSEHIQAIKNGLPGNKNIHTSTDIVNAYNNGDAEVVEAVNRYFTPPTIHTLDALDAALQQSKQETQAAKPKNKKSNKNKNNNPLPKLTESTLGSNTPVNSDVRSYTPQSIIDKARETYKGDPLIERVTNFLEPLIKANPNIKINYEAKFPFGVMGYSHPDGSIDLNFAAHPNEGALLQNGLHEFVHAVTRNELENNKAFRGEIDKALSRVREHMGLPDSDFGVKTAMNMLNATGNLKIEMYGAADAHELIAELFTNQAFRDELSKIRYEGDSLLTKLFEIIAKYLSQAYNKLVGAKQAITANDLGDFLTQLVEQSITGEQGNDTAGSLPMMAQSQEDALRKIIKATSRTITDDQLKERIVAATGLQEDLVQELIDEVRKPPELPLDPMDTIGTMRFQEVQIARNKFKRVRQKKKSNEPTWWQRQWEAVKNGSAWTDNTYRFITKISEDINKVYGLINNEAIPLGRQFEKSAAGRAILKVDSYINEVIRGHINGKNYGRLKGEKYTDFLDYVAAKRVIDRLNKQQDKQLAGEDVSRRTGNITRQDAAVTIEYMRRKYNGLEEFEARANALQEHMDRMLRTLVGAGILNRETYNQIKADNEFYAPFSVVQSKLYADQSKQPVGISGIVKRIKGIDYDLIKSGKVTLKMLDALGGALEENIISPEEYFKVALEILNDLKADNKITNEEYDSHIAKLENPGFAINDILDTAANMILKAEGMALRNTMLQRLYAYKSYDTEGLFIQDVDGYQAMTLPDGSTRMVAKPLSSIKVEPGMAPIKLRVDGKDIIVAVDKRAATKLTTKSNYETAALLKASNAVNKLFRTIVITLSPGFQIANFVIDFARTSTFSRYGMIAGKGLVQPMVNFLLYVPQYIDALFHSTVNNLGFKTATYKQWMESDSFSKGMFDHLFDNQKRIKEVNAPLAKRILMDLLKLKFIEVPGSILEQTHKLAVHQRGMSIEGLKPEMATAMLASAINRNIKPDMNQEELSDAMDRLHYEVQNFAGSPNFPETHGWMKALSMVLQFFSARVKGEMSDFRRVLNVFTGKGEGVKLSRQEAMQIGVGQMGAATLMILAYAVKNNLKDDDEDEFMGVSPYRRDNALNLPLGYYEYEDDDGGRHKLRDYAQIPLRGVTATVNVMANSFIKFKKRHNPEEFKKAGLAFLANASPINLNGSDEREIGESLFSNLTPIFKYFVEYSFNRDTHNHRNIIPDFVQGRGMLSKFRNGDIEPWDVATKKTPLWAKTWSKFLFDNLGIRVSAIELNHMEDGMGNPTDMYNSIVDGTVLKKRFFRSGSTYPLYTPPTTNKNTSSTTKTPVIE